VSVVESTRPKVVWLDDDTGKVYVQSHHIADIWWNGMEWYFMRYEIVDGEKSMTTTEQWTWINVEPDLWVKLRNSTNDLNARAHSLNVAEYAALKAELDLERMEFRDDTKEFAELVAIGYGRLWWKTYRNWTT
jgi:hypothetical protein